MTAWTKRQLEILQALKDDRHAFIWTDFPRTDGAPRHWLYDPTGDHQDGIRLRRISAVTAHELAVDGKLRRESVPASWMKARGINAKDSWLVEWNCRVYIWRHRAHAVLPLSEIGL